MPAKRNAARPTVVLALGWYVNEIVAGVARYAREAGWILYDTPSHSRLALAHVGPCDGIITLLGSAREQPMIRHCLRVRVPVVDLSDQLPELPFPRVLPDNEAIGRMGAQHLLECGLRHLAFLELNSAAPVVMERKNAFERAVTRAGRPFHRLDATATANRDIGRIVPWLARRLADLPRPLGIMAQYDGEAVFVLQACREAGLRVPEDVAVLGVDNDPIYCELGLVPLSSVDTNREMQGYRAAELLARLMAGGPAPARAVRIPPVGVVPRKSTEIAAISDAEVARALRYIAANFSKPIRVSDVVAAAGGSRRSLYNKFAREIGRSIARELRRRRIEHARRLLVSGRRKLDAVAEQSGFEDAKVFSKCFKQCEGVSPARFRALHTVP
jgi:LacI family transcriptional regulator